MLKGVCIGAGYFAQFHYEAWSRIDTVDIAAACDLDGDKIKGVCDQYGIARRFTDYEQMFDEVEPDFVDIITPPPTHLPIVKSAAKRGIHIICQKPLAPTWNEAMHIMNAATSAGIRFMVHENFRFQPWHREIKKLIDQGEIGDQLFSLNFRLRQGDGWGEDAYLGRQPYFRTMPRLLLHETGIHFIDTFQFLGGEMTRVFARMRRLNPVIAGEDYALVQFDFKDGAIATWDATRYNEANDENPRYTFGDFVIDGNGGTIRLYLDGRITIQKLGEKEEDHSYEHRRANFSGDCVYFVQKHFVEAMMNGAPFETDVERYMKNILIEEACYKSAELREPVDLADFEPNGDAAHSVVAPPPGE